MVRYPAQDDLNTSDHGVVIASLTYSGNASAQISPPIEILFGRLKDINH